MRTAYAVAILFLLASCQRGGSQPETRSAASRPSPIAQAPVPTVPSHLLASPAVAFGSAPTSLVALLADPQRFHGKEVTIIGYAHLEFEGCTLCLSRSDSENVIAPNCVALDLPLRPEFTSLSNRNVLVRGIFDAKKGADIYPGSLTRISRYEAWLRRDEVGIGVR
jgi:hypothetical protein